MRIRTIFFAVAAALVVAAAALAAPTAKDPSRLILERKDFPAHSDYEAGDELDYTHALRSIDARTTGYYAGTYSETKGHLQLHGAVITTRDVKTAKQALRLAEKHLQDTWKVTGAGYKPTSTGIPAYGDQQAAFSKKATVLSSTGSVALFVRKRSRCPSSRSRATASAASVAPATAACRRSGPKRSSAPTVSRAPSL